METNFVNFRQKCTNVASCNEDVTKSEKNVSISRIIPFFYLDLQIQIFFVSRQIWWYLMKPEKHNLNISPEVYKVSKTVETHNFSVGKIKSLPLSFVPNVT